MVLACTRFSACPEVEKASRNAPPLRQGVTNEGVRVIQMAFIDLGFAMPVSTTGGTKLPDGIFGSETVKVALAFQKANGLVPDAVVGAMTIARLDALMAARSEAQLRADQLSRRKATGD